MSKWQLVSLGEICEITGGNSAPQGTEPYDGGTMPFVRMRDLGRYHFTSNLNQTDDKLTEAAIQKYRMKIFEPGCLLFPRSGSVFLNHRAILGTRACIVSHIGVMQHFKPSINVQFLYYFLQTFDMTRLSKKTTGVDSIAFSDVARIKVPLPPLAEQERIVCLLDEAEALRKLRSQASERMEEFVPALFHELFGDPEHTKYEIRNLTELVAPGRPITYGILKPGPDIPNGVPYIRVVDIKGGHLQKEQLRKTTTKIALEYKRSTLAGGDILITIRGTVGRTCIVPNELSGANITQDTARISCSETLDATYVMGFLNTFWAQSWMQHHTRGQAVQGLNIGDLRKLPVPLPPLGLQRRFAQRAQEAREIQSRQARSAERIEALYQSMLSRAFAGEL